MVKEIGIDKPEEWTEYVSNCVEFDFYHTPCYYSLDKNNCHESLLFVVEINGDFIAFPLIVRPIEGTEFFDCTSAYGYCGPISNVSFQKIPQGLISFFQDELINFFKRKNIVTTFSRMHPIFNQQRVFFEFGVVKDVNRTVAIDLKLSPEEQRRQYRKSNKSEINQLRKKAYKIVEAQRKK